MSATVDLFRVGAHWVEYRGWSWHLLPCDERWTTSRANWKRYRKRHGYDKPEGLPTRVLQHQRGKRAADELFRRSRFG